MATQNNLSAVQPAPPQRRAASLSIDNISFSYPNGHAVFNAFSLHAQPGEFVSLLGPSGCGKTTLLNLLSGFQQPTSGTISINHQPVRPEMPELGYVFQSPQLFPWLTALENVRFGLRMQNQLGQKEQTEKAMHYLSLVGLDKSAGKLPYQLSGGMQQRVSLARALALEPALLLMDEPFAALDAITRSHLNEETLRLWSELGQTVLFITHDIDEAIFLADRVVVLGIAPQGIHSEQAIDIPRPRTSIHTRKLPSFIEHRTTLMGTIADVIHTNLSVSNINA
ncbi:ABC transporter ATP-binding protein [Methylophilus sp. Q8]|uniref:ABC transporter ATP-binding protein n=1 Tax=Methylophilus sp. Q8 TaxID=1506586 RepID=UPI00068A832E|nr:ABC transporter ATP-binding protein [Methylophilus sp. Q8]